MASTIADECLVREHERIVDKLNGRHFLGAYHHLERFNPLTNRRGNRRIGGRGRPYSGDRESEVEGKSEDLRERRVSQKKTIMLQLLPTSPYFSNTKRQCTYA